MLQTQVKFEGMWWQSLNFHNYEDIQEFYSAYDEHKDITKYGLYNLKLKPAYRNEDLDEEVILKVY